MYKKEPILVILAAGLGSRYGGMKQVDAVGSDGEAIIDFSIYDAYRAGFRRVILIIRREHEALFRKNITDKIGDHMEVQFAYQDLNDIPAVFHVPEGRNKPWGTTHALLACRNIIDAPFAIINADDFYGRAAYETIYQFLTTEAADDYYGMVGYECQKTVSKNGTVTRAICEQNDAGFLQKIREVKQIGFVGDSLQSIEDGAYRAIDPMSPVSMNFWGFTPKIFLECREIFEDFLKKELSKDPQKCEHVIPTAVGDLIKKELCSVRVLHCNAEWFGVTYKEDKPCVVARIKELRDSGIYPKHLWTED